MDPITLPREVATPNQVGYEESARMIHASFGQRVLAWFIDWCALSLIRLFLIVVLGFIAYAIDAAGLETEAVKAVEGLSFLAILYLGTWHYYALLESSRWQATLGKRAGGIVVSDIGGGNATFAQTTVRFLLRIASALPLGLGFLYMLLNRCGQTLHDIAANCVVIRQEVRPAFPLASVPG